MLAFVFVSVIKYAYRILVGTSIFRLLVILELLLVPCVICDGGYRSWFLLKYCCCRVAQLVLVEV